MVIVFMWILILIAWAIVNVGCSEILQTRIRNDLASAGYAAEAGAERMFARLKASQTQSWPQSLEGVVRVSISGSYTYNAGYDVSADLVDNDEFLIMSDGTVNGRKAVLSVKYGYLADSTIGIPLASVGAMSIRGMAKASKVRINDGPVVSNSTITQTGYVETPANDVWPNRTFPAGELNTPSFWLDLPFDTNCNYDYVLDTDHDGVITREEAIAQGKEAAFDADNAYKPAGTSDENEINAKDAFYNYYVTYLNNPINNKLETDLGIGAPGAGNEIGHHYVGSKSFGLGAPDGFVSDEKAIIFIDGDVAINYNDQDWRGDETLNHTIVSMGNVTITQPTNREGDVLTIIAYGDVAINSTMGDRGGTTGDIIIYTDGDFTANGGGKMSGSIFAKGNLVIDTQGTTGKYHRTFNKSTIDWTDPSKRPLGLPPNYAIVSVNFSINESTYGPNWQRH